MMVSAVLLFAYIQLVLAVENIIPDAVNLLLCSRQCQLMDMCQNLLYSATTLRCKSYQVANNSPDGRRETGNATKESCRTNEIWIKTRFYELKCKKAGHDEYRWKEGLPEAGGKQDVIILYDKKDLELTSRKLTVELPFTLTPGMQLIVIMSRSREPTTVLEFPSNRPMMPSALSMTVYWKSKMLSFDVMLDITNAKFNNADSSNFTLCLEQTKQNTKIFTDGTLVFSYSMISGLRKFTLVDAQKVTRVAVVKREASN